MSVASNYLCAVTAGVVTAGLTAAVAAVPPEQASVTHRDVALTQTTIPITDVDETYGPLHVVQKQTAIFNADVPGQIKAGLTDSNSTTWTGQQGGHAGVNQGSEQFVTLFGDGPGYGVGLSGTSAAGTASFDLPGIGNGDFSGTVGQYIAAVKAYPDEGLAADLALNALAGGGNGAITLGDYAVSGGGGGAIAGSAQLCLGSNLGCHDVGIVSGQASAAGSAGFTVTGPGGTKTVTIISPTGITAALKSDELSVTGQVGGTVKVGTRTFGRVRDIDIHVPTTSAVTLASSNRQAQGLSNSQQAAPGEKVKTAVRAAKHRAQSRHAAAD